MDSTSCSTCRQRCCVCDWDSAAALCRGELMWAGVCSLAESTCVTVLLDDGSWVVGRLDVRRSRMAVAPATVFVRTDAGVVELNPERVRTVVPHRR